MAFLDPGLQGNRILEKVAHPSDWIRENVTVEFDDKSRTILLRLRCRAEWSTDASLLLETIADVLADHLTSQDRRTRYDVRESAESSLSLIRSKVLRNESLYDRVKRDPTISESFRDEVLSYRREQIEKLNGEEERVLEILELVEEDESNPLEVRRRGRVKVEQTW